MRQSTVWRMPLPGCPNDVRVSVAPTATRPSCSRSKGQCAGGDESLYLAPHSTAAQRMQKAPLPGPFLFVIKGAPHCYWSLRHTLGGIV